MSIASNLAKVTGNIEAACSRAGRHPGSCRLVAVSKGQAAGALIEAVSAGQRIFGENYVQELVAKSLVPGLDGGIEWHFIGHLQRNKARQVVGLVSMIQTVDSRRLVEELAARLRAAGRGRLDVLVEVNLGLEPGKSGARPDDVEPLLDAIESAGVLACRGLMVIPPFEIEPEDARRWFAGLRELRDRLGGAQRLPELSMGMSSDYEVAVEEGATLVRVGTAIFGSR